MPDMVACVEGVVQMRLVDHFGIGIGKSSGGGAVNSFVLLDTRWLWINGPQVSYKWFGMY